MSELSIAGHLKFLKDLDEHGCTKEFDYSIKLLENKIYALLKQTIRKDEFSWRNRMGWFEEIQALSPETKNVMEGILKWITSPAPKILLKLAITDSVEQIRFSQNGTRVVIIYKEGFMYGSKVEIRDLESVNRKPFFVDYDVIVMYFNSDKTKVAIKYFDGRWKIRDLVDKNREPLCVGNNVRWIKFNSDGTRIAIIYENGRGEIRELVNKNREPLFVGNNVLRINFDSDGTRFPLYMKMVEGK